MNTHVPYTYLIGWKNHNMWYYGVRYAKVCNPKDFWLSYFTSSRYVKEFREKNGEPDVIQIRKIFSNRDSAQKWETKVLQKMNVINDNRFLNKAIGRSLQDYENYKKVMLQRYRVENVSQMPGISNKISKALKGKIKTEKHKQNLKESHNKPETKELHSQNTKEIKAGQTLEKRREIGALAGAGNKGVPKSSAWKEKTNKIKRKTYLINNDIIVENAKEYCIENSLNYAGFTQAAKYNKIWKGLKIEVIL